MEESDGPRPMNQCSWAPGQQCTHVCCRRARRQAPFSRPSASLSKKTPADLSVRLPSGQDSQAKEQRRQLFQQIDLNGNGYLSLAEVDQGVMSPCSWWCVHVVVPSFLPAVGGHCGSRHPTSTRAPYIQVRDVFDCEAMFKAKPVIMRAFQASRMCRARSARYKRPCCAGGEGC